jgi:PAS domain S-box-containing protein
MKRLNHHQTDTNGELFLGNLNSHPLGIVLERWAAYTDLSVVIADPGGFIVWVNPAFTRMCGYNSDELLGRRPGHILSGAMSEKQSREVLNEAIRNRESVQTRLVNYAKGGKPYWVDIHLEPIVDSQGHLMGFISIEKDVTKEECHQHELGELSASIYEELVKKVGKNGGSPLGAKGIKQAVVPISLGRTRNGKQTR